jgi:hypothetical protein
VVSGTFLPLFAGTFFADHGIVVWPRLSLARKETVGYTPDATGVRLVERRPQTTDESLLELTRRTG